MYDPARQRSRRKPAAQTDTASILRTGADSAGKEASARLCRDGRSSSMTLQDAELLYRWLIATYGDPTLEGTPRTVLTKGDNRQRSHDDTKGNPNDRIRHHQSDGDQQADSQLG